MHCVECIGETMSTIDIILLCLALDMCLLCNRMAGPLVQTQHLKNCGTRHLLNILLKTGTVQLWQLKKL